MKKIFLIPAVLFFVIPAVFFFRAILPFNPLSFIKSVDNLMKKTELLAERSRAFSGEKALLTLGENSINGFYYRFDDHLDDAVKEYKEAAVVDDRSGFGDTRFEFTDAATARFMPQNSACQIEGGVIRLLYVKGGYLHNTSAISIEKDDIAEIEIRIKMKLGKRMTLGWSVNGDAVFTDRDVGVITVETVADNAYHVYRINAKNALKRRLQYGDVIRKVFLQPSDIPGDEVAIDYIRFISKSSKYSSAPWGKVYETLNKEMRQAIYANTDSRIAYDISVPDEELFLRFGIGIMHEDIPVDCRVTVTSGGIEEKVFSETITSADIWYDKRIDLSAWSGKKITVAFSAYSRKTNTVFWSNPIIYAAPKERFNIIVILEDALRADHMSCYGYFRQTTPVKDLFVEDGVLFRHAFSQATKTRPSVPSLMTSLYPTATGVWNFSESLDDAYLTLAEIMRHQGFETASFVQNGNAGPYSGLHQGFGTLFDEATIGVRADELYGNRLFAWIDEHRERNFFLYAHLVDPHSPYDPQPPFDAWYRETPAGSPPLKHDARFDPPHLAVSSQEARRRLYDGEILNNDFYFGRFLEALEARGILRDTLIIVTADHGEFLGEHNKWEHRPPGYIQVLRVPLLMVGPTRLPQNTVVTPPVQLIDIMPTILECAGIRTDSLIMQGDSLLSLARGDRRRFWEERVVASEEVVLKKKRDALGHGSFFFKNWHLMYSDAIDRKGTPSAKMPFYKRIKTFFTVNNFRIFDYIADEDESRDDEQPFLSALCGRPIGNMLRKLQEHNTVIWERITKGSRRDILHDPDVTEHLKALGYLQ